MKILSVLILVSGVALTSSASELQKIGTETDYTASVLKEYAPSGATSLSNILLKNGLLYGGYIYGAKSRDWSTVAADFQSKLNAAIKADGWELDGPEPKALTVPSRFIYLARRGDETLELNVWLFPVQDAKVGVSYTQGRR